MRPSSPAPVRRPKEHALFWRIRLAIVGIALLFASSAMVLVRFSLGASDDSLALIRLCRGLLNGTVIASGYSGVAVMQVYVLGRRGWDGAFRLPRLRRRAVGAIVGLVAVLAGSEMVKDSLSPRDRADLYDPSASTPAFRAYYTAHVAVVYLSYSVFFPAAAGAFDPLLVRLGVQTMVDPESVPQQRALDAAPGPAAAAPGPRGSRCCLCARHPATVFAVTFSLGTLAIQLQAYGQTALAVVLLPAVVVGWAIIASRWTLGVGSATLRRRVLAIVLGIAAGGGGTLASGRLFGFARSLGDASLAKLGVSALYSASMLVLILVWERTARQTFRAEHTVTLFLPQLVEAVFGELFFLVFVPFSPAFYGALALNVAKGALLCLDPPSLARRWLARRGPRLRELLAAVERAGPEEGREHAAALGAEVAARARAAAARWRVVDHALVAEAVAVVVAPAAIGVDLALNAAGLGAPSLTRGLTDAERWALLRGYGLIFLAQAALTLAVSDVHRRRLQRMHALLCKVDVREAVSALSRRGPRGVGALAPLMRRISGGRRAGSRVHPGRTEARPAAHVGDSAARAAAATVGGGKGGHEGGARGASGRLSLIAITPVELGGEDVPSLEGSTTEDPRSHHRGLAKQQSVYVPSYEFRRSSERYWVRHRFLFLAFIVHAVVSSIVEVGVIYHVASA